MGHNCVGGREGVYAIGKSGATTNFSIVEATVTNRVSMLREGWASMRCTQWGEFYVFFVFVCVCVDIWEG